MSVVRARWFLRLAFAVAAALWAVTIPIAAYVLAQPDAATSPFSLAGLAVYELGSFICHQRPERSFRLSAMPLPVCARCTGIYAGAAITALVTVLHRVRPGAPRLTRDAAPSMKVGEAAGLTPARARAVLAAAATPALITLIYEWAGGAPPSNELRGLSGIVLGCGVAWTLLKVE
jgi:uncharacterized membrane protein